MFFGVIASDGKKVPPIFVEPGLKIDAPAYKSIICRKLKPWVNANRSYAWLAQTPAFIGRACHRFWRRLEACAVAQAQIYREKKGRTSWCTFFFTWHNLTWRNFGVIFVY